ncbi:protein Dok-7-like isoform X2 [Pseudoliparis swirei]|uniref:protein Dok-7-like isoform X2 n=1 Tax=Pseudoliparis swirei TaxID=2059687 RepID=UPI0024BE3E7E|nr:protein Dok-7-like isoform X2 [Pseudoliparis swirei]
MTDTVVAEGHVKFRDGKKWKTRCVVLRKPSPVADCLSLLVYKERKKGKEKTSGLKESLNVTLEGICGVEPGPGYDGVSYTLSILCLAHTLVLGFSSRDALLAWDAHVRYSLGEVHRFSVSVEPGTKLESGPASLHLCNDLLVVTRGVPPVAVGHWKLSALRRYGAVTNGFVFEGGTRCGFWAGVFFLSCAEGEQISFLFDCVIRGVASGRTPRGQRPALPEPGADPESAERRISQEAWALEKRLSVLSQSSGASAYSYGTSVAGDDRSGASSSSSGQSEASYGSRLPLWAEPLAKQRLHRDAASSSSSTPKALASSDDRLYAAVTGSSGARPSSARPHARRLHDGGRQSSPDSGIGIAPAGSRSSCSGSFSSCTGSLDAASQGGEAEFGSVASLPSSPPPPPPLPLPSQSTLTPDRSGEYQTPGPLRPQYDTPRSLLKTPGPGEPAHHGGPAGVGGDGRGSHGDRPWAQHQGATLCWRAPPVDSEGGSTPRPLLTPGGVVCGETQCGVGLDYVTPEQWRAARDRGVARGVISPSGRPPPAEPREDQDEAGLRRAKSCLPPSAPPPFALGTQRPTSACGFFRSAALDTRLHQDRPTNYANVRVGARPSPGELVLAGTGSASRDAGAIGHAHLDVTAMETARRRGGGACSGQRGPADSSGERRGPPG